MVEMTRARALERVNLQGWNSICRQVWMWASTFVSDTLLSEHSFMALHRWFELVSYKTTRARERERFKKKYKSKKILVTNFFLKYVLNTIKRKKKWKKKFFFFGRRRPFFRPSIAQSPFFLWKWNAVSILYNFCFHRFTLRSL